MNRPSIPNDRRCGRMDVHPALPPEAEALPPRSGFTLLEMILALSVLVILSAIFWPNLISLRTGTRLERTADDVRGMLTGLRVRAMEEGTVYQFAYSPETGAYRVSVAGQQAAPDGQGPSQSTSDSDISVSFDSGGLVGSHVLETDIVFSQGEVPESEGGVARGGRQDVGSESVDGWPMISFFADGRSTSARFFLYDELGAGREVAVRGLTGAVTVMPAPSRAGPGRMAPGGGR